ncbi:hypothetical protein [Bradyrhizobium sp. ISRA426]|nr:hypothetical protein [Bradyrhizobium sp. ISRA426]WGR70191.1 hypothetical protein MTX24_33110 [Bradyrhizobium sp. ISRA426]WGR85434.1 hypothetical protein MTX25_32785 [Bradyrhizobium sp. ISRA432]
MRKHKIMMPPDTITTRIDGWVGTADRMPASIAELISRHAGARNPVVAAIRARMQARHEESFGHD